MKKAILIPLILILSLLVYETVSCQEYSPIDKTAEIYKNKPNITISTVKGDFTAVVRIKVNKKLKTESITISGTTENKEALDLFLEDLYDKRDREGYTFVSKRDPSKSITTEIVSVEEVTLKKGDMYTIVTKTIRSVDDKTQPMYSWEHEFSGYLKKRVYDLLINIQDLNRMNNGEGRSIDF